MYVLVLEKNQTKLWLLTLTKFNFKLLSLKQENYF